jgi:hypothetical protein
MLAEEFAQRIDHFDRAQFLKSANLDPDQFKRTARRPPPASGAAQMGRPAAREARTRASRTSDRQES